MGFVPVSGTAKQDESEISYTGINSKFKTTDFFYKWFCQSKSTISLRDISSHLLAAKLFKPIMFNFSQTKT